MTEPSIRNRYFQLLKSFVTDPNEQHLVPIAELGRELISADVPPEVLAEIHEAAIHRLGTESPDLTLLESTRLVMTPFMEMLMAYGLAFRQRAEQRQRAEEQNARLAAAVEQAAEAIVITDTQGTIQYTNPAFERTTGYTRREALGRNPRILKSEKQDEAFYKQLWDTITRGKVWTGHFINKKKDGTLYEEEAAISPVRDADGNIINFVGVKRDVTREVELEAQLRQAQKMEAIGQLAGGVAHDFNNILTTILGNTEMLLDMIGQDRSTESNASAVPALQQIQTAGERAAALTRQLLTFSRKQVETPAILDPNRIVAGMENMLRRLIGEHIGLETIHASDVHRIRADATQIEQVIVNLVLNARDAMPDGGTVTIHTANAVLDETYAAAHVGASAGRHVMIAVADTGAGMDAETLNHIFEPFFTTKPVDKGTGLGLATVYGTVHQAGGHISVDSRPGHGTTFKVFLPVVDAPAEPPETQTASTRPGGYETILVCEDEKMIRELVCRILEDRGYNVIVADNGTHALQVAAERQVPIHLLLTDVIMPEMNGQELAAALAPRHPKIKALFMSGYTSDVITPHALANNSLEFLQKPFTPTDLLQRVRQVLDQATQ